MCGTISVQERYGGITRSKDGAQSWAGISSSRFQATVRDRCPIRETATRHAPFRPALLGAERRSRCLCRRSRKERPNPVEIAGHSALARTVSIPVPLVGTDDGSILTMHHHAVRGATLSPASHWFVGRDLGAITEYDGPSISRRVQVLCARRPIVAHRASASRRAAPNGTTVT